MCALVQCLHWKTIPMSWGTAMQCNAMRKEERQSCEKKVPSSWRMAKKTTIITIVKKRVAYTDQSYGELGRMGGTGDRYVVSVHYDLKDLYSNTRSMLRQRRQREQRRCRWGTNKQTNKRKKNKTKNENIKIYKHWAHATSSYSRA